MTEEKSPLLPEAERIHQEWLKDCAIDDSALDKAAINVPMLHSKWLRILDLTKQKRREHELAFFELKKKRVLWYEGMLSKEEIDELEWAYDPFDGKLVKTKTQKEQYIKTDTLIKEAEAEMEQWNNAEETAKEILDSIRWRTQTIRAAIDAKRLEVGF